jgi:hypothetical protein
MKTIQNKFPTVSGDIRVTRRHTSSAIAVQQISEGDGLLIITWRVNTEHTTAK